MSRFDADFTEALDGLAAGRRVLRTRAAGPACSNVSGNDYLGLSRHPR